MSRFIRPFQSFSFIFIDRVSLALVLIAAKYSEVTFYLVFLQNVAKEAQYIKDVCFAMVLFD